MRTSFLFRCFFGKELRILRTEGIEAILINGLTDALRKGIVEIEIVGYGELSGKNLVGLEQMSDIGTGEIAAGRAAAFRIDRTGIRLIIGIFQMADAFPGKDGAMSCITGGHDAVEHIDASCDGLDDIGRGTHAHEVAGLMDGHMGYDNIEDVVHILGRFTDGKTADGIAIEVHFGDFLHMLDTELIECTALIDAEEQLILIDGIGEAVEPLHFVLTAFEPAHGACAGTCGIVIGSGILNAFIECHGDGRTEIRLDTHALLGAHEDFLAVVMRIEVDAFLLNLTQLCEGKDLKSAAVGKNGTLPVHELMKAAHLADDVIAGTQVEMVGIAQLDLTLEIDKLGGRNAALDGSGGTDIHEAGGLHGTVDGVECTAACGTIVFE